MIEVYYYLPSGEVDNAIECGLKLSRWFDKEVVINGDLKKCMSCLLNPKDDIIKYRSENLTCIKFELPPNYCFVADKCLYEAGQAFPEVMDLYMKSIKPLGEYMFGSYRLPECLVTATVIPGQISYLNKTLDIPVLFGNSEELYINNMIETYKEKYDDFSDTILYHFYVKLAESGVVEKYEECNSGITVFVDRNSGKSTVLRIPDMTKYRRTVD